MSDMKIFIDNNEINAKGGDTILMAARRAGYYIPTMCFLQKCEPIASCRLCVVEVEGQDGLILSCQAKAVDGLKVTINSEKLQSERAKIMELYCVNHPLECGVCDKSGECDLQNKTLEFDIDAQNFMAKEQRRDIKDWQFIQYDPSLCILCEKCVHVCNEIVGDDAITIQYGGYKSTIIPKNSENLDCTMCGECIAVCPVGALISSDFKYRANSWEMTKVPSACTHCSSACQLYYESRHDKVESTNKKLYRVSNDFEYSSLCAKGRFDFDFANKDTRDELALNRAITALKNAKAIKFTSKITNESAMILQALKKSLGVKLINSEAYAFKKFMDSYSNASGDSLYGANLEDIKNSDFIVVFGAKIANENPMVRYAINQASKKKNAEVVYAHPIEDHLMSSVVTKYVKYEPSSENGVMTILTNMFVKKESLIGYERSYFDNLDLGYISSECSFDEEEQEIIKKAMIRKKSPTIILGSDLFTHQNAEHIAKLAGILARSSGFNVLIMPSDTNTLGVSKICELDEDGEYGFTVGIDCKGDFELSSARVSGENTLGLPALNQQEGTITNIDKRVVPINVAIAFDGYNLNDLACAVGVGKKTTINFTVSLPTDVGFEAVDFDSLSNFYSKDGEDARGYELRSTKSEPAAQHLDDISSIGEMNGVLVYLSNPPLSFVNSAKGGDKRVDANDIILGSRSFMTAAKVTDGANISVEVGNKKLQRKFALDDSMKGTIALVQIDSNFGGYKIQKANIYNVEC
jgi:NADH-quinone oxidoreductase subunit G